MRRLVECHQYLPEQDTVKMFPVRKSIVLTVQTLDAWLYRRQLVDTTNYINYRQTGRARVTAPTFVNICTCCDAAQPPLRTLRPLRLSPPRQSKLGHFTRHRIWITVNFGHFICIHFIVCPQTTLLQLIVIT